VLHHWILRLLLGAISLPILMCVLGGLSYLFEALQDEAGARFVGRANLVLAVVWIFDLLLLLISVGVHALQHDLIGCCEDLSGNDPNSPDPIDSE